MAWLPGGLFMCVAGGSRVLAGGRSACWDLGLRASSFRFCLVGRGWPTRIHGPGLRAQHDFADFGGGPFLESFLPDGTGAGGALFVLPKGV